MKDMPVSRTRAVFPQTIYAVGLLYRKPGNDWIFSPSFVVSGVDPLTKEEAIALGRRAVEGMDFSGHPDGERLSDYRFVLGTYSFIVQGPGDCLPDPGGTTDGT
jgi:hypothetical protein